MIHLSDHSRHVPAGRHPCLPPPWLSHNGALPTISSSSDGRLFWVFVLFLPSGLSIVLCLSPCSCSLGSAPSSLARCFLAYAVPAGLSLLSLNEVKPHERHPRAASCKSWRSKSVRYPSPPTVGLALSFSFLLSPATTSLEQSFPKLPASQTTATKRQTRVIDPSNATNLSHLNDTTAGRILIQPFSNQDAASVLVD